jgi:hypothetical protein
MSDWPDHRGIGGQIIVERVAECSWNRWPNARGKHTNVATTSPASYMSLMTEGQS